VVSIQFNSNPVKVNQTSKQLLVQDCLFKDNLAVNGGGLYIQKVTIILKFLLKFIYLFFFSQYLKHPNHLPGED
jgi:predicted outer membrane repeat protein